VRKAIATIFAAVMLTVAAAPAFAVPKPPTQGGNGAGQSGQCTGPADERPASCQSP
jgi:hypothetical protein